DEYVSDVSTVIPFRPLPVDPSDVRYLHGPDSTTHEGVPSGTVTELEWNDSTIYPRTSRTFWVYVPAQYDASEPASLVVFQDGKGY
ncbi:esterase family protein, partial [Klebsiella michiganensis]|nr:esterase family protein [Klebsiella michiganensis]